jgi:hypothetical protein
VLTRLGPTLAGRGSDPSQRARYGGPWFAAATSLRLDGGLGRPERLIRLLASGARRPHRLFSLVALLVKTPTDVVLLSRSHAGIALRTYFDARFLGVFPQNRLCRGVLLLPTDYTDYRRGHRRQALRTNLRRAADAGIWCESASDPAEALEALAEVLTARTNTPGDPAELLISWEDHFSRPETTTVVARDSAGRPMAVAAAVIDAEVCLIQFAVASSHEARWALHDHLVRALTERGVKYLLAEGGGPFGALGFEAELHHYQHLLGYELRHLIPVSA